MSIVAVLNKTGPVIQANPSATLCLGIFSMEQQKPVSGRKQRFPNQSGLYSAVDGSTSKRFPYEIDDPLPPVTKLRINVIGRKQHWQQIALGLSKYLFRDAHTCIAKHF